MSTILSLISFTICAYGCYLMCISWTWTGFLTLILGGILVLIQEAIPKKKYKRPLFYPERAEDLFTKEELEEKVKIKLPPYGWSPGRHHCSVGKGNEGNE